MYLNVSILHTVSGMFTFGEAQGRDPVTGIGETQWSKPPNCRDEVQMFSTCGNSPYIRLYLGAVRQSQIGQRLSQAARVLLNAVCNKSIIYLTEFSLQHPHTNASLEVYSKTKLPEPLQEEEALTGRFDDVE